MIRPFPTISLLACLLGAAVASPVFAQDEEKEDKAVGVSSRAEAMRRQREDRRSRKESKSGAQAETKAEVVVMYPQATRQEPAAKASPKLSPKLKKMFEAYDADEAATVLALADEVIANPAANPYERAIAARIAGASQLNVDDAKAKAYLQKAIEFNGLGNNEHFESMQLLAQLQIQDEQYAEGLATLEKFLADTGSQKPEHLAIKGNALYRLERYPEAAAVLKQAVTASAESKADWLQLLMGAYFEMNQPAEAARIAEELSAKSPNDKRLQMNLASIYIQADQIEKAVAVLEKLRVGGQLSDEKDYRNLYALYLNAQGKEKQAIAVINEGLQKGLLKPDFQTYNALAQAYWFSEQPAQAIDAYRKAAPLAPDGETYLNLARALQNEGKTAEAKQAAQQALAKGVKKPEDAKRILGAATK